MGKINRIKRMAAKVKGAVRNNFTDMGGARSAMRKTIKAGRKSGSRASATDVYKSANSGIQLAKLKRRMAGISGTALVTGIGYGMYKKKKDGSKSKSMGRKSK